MWPDVPAQMEMDMTALTDVPALTDMTALPGGLPLTDVMTLTGGQAG